MASVIWVRVRVKSPSRGEPRMNRPPITASSTAATPNIDARRIASSVPDLM